MRRLLTLVCFFGLAMFSTGAGVIAQESTPASEQMGPPESFELAPGVVADSIVFQEGQENPSLYRLHFDAGVDYEVTPASNLEVAYLESGSLTVTLTGTVVVFTLGETDDEGDVMPANTEFKIEAGQFLVLQPGVGGTIHNDGTEVATVSVAGLTPAGATMPSLSPEATPAN